MTAIKILARLFFSLFLLLMLGIAALYSQYHISGCTPLQPPTQDPLLRVRAGDSIDGISHELQKRGVIQYAWPLSVYARVKKLAEQLQVGDYLLSANITGFELIENIAHGKVIQYRLTVIEGSTFRDLQIALAEHPHIIQTLHGRTPESIATLLGIEGHPEGQFLPDTYYFSGETRDIDLLKRLHQKMQNTLDELWAQRSSGLPMKSPYEALILASLIEKETSLPEERAQIAGVFIRRLQQNMRLQTDPSVMYGVAPDYRSELTRSQLRTDTRYNTYTRHGLPPTPIALPSRASIEAALHPAAGSSLYFVANGNGGHTFSDTYAEHLKAVKTYRDFQKRK